MRLTEVAGVFEMRRADSDSESDSDNEVRHRVAQKASDKLLTLDTRFQKASKKATERENRRMLIEEFGSRKKKRAMHSRDLARIDIDQSGSTGAINLALEAGIESKNKGIEDLSRHFLPQYNLEATEAKLIYPFDLSKTWTISPAPCQCIHPVLQCFRLSLAALSTPLSFFNWRNSRPTASIPKKCWGPFALCACPD